MLKKELGTLIYKYFVEESLDHGETFTDNFRMIEESYRDGQGIEHVVIGGASFTRDEAKAQSQLFESARLRSHK